jgi:hypothetical protein
LIERVRSKESDADENEGAARRPRRLQRLPGVSNKRSVTLRALFAPLPLRPAMR